VRPGPASPRQARIRRLGPALVSSASRALVSGHDGRGETRPRMRALSKTRGKARSTALFSGFVSSRWILTRIWPHVSFAGSSVLYFRFSRCRQHSWQGCGDDLRIRSPFPEVTHSTHLCESILPTSKQTLPRKAQPVRKARDPTSTYRVYCSRLSR